MAQRGLLGAAEGERDDGGQAGEREDVDGVVVEDRDQAEGLARAQELEVVIRDHLAGQVALPFHAEDLVLQVHQAAAFEAQLPQPARAEEQVQMRQTVERVAGPRHAEAGFEQRLIVRLAVVGDQDIELREVLGETVEERGLLAVIAHEELAQAEAGRVDRADADEERVSTGTAREAGGFGVEKRPACGGCARDFTAGERIEQVFGERGEIGDIHAAVAAMALPNALGFEVLAEGRPDDLAGHELLDQVAAGVGFARRGGRALRRTPLDPGNAAAQGGELLLDVLHASLFLCSV